jgi:hypothetical protein
MTRTRNLSDLLDSGGDVKASALDNATTSLSDLGVTATATELNYVDGVTSNIQTQIDGITSDLVDDTTPQLGGDLSTNGNDVNFGDNDKAQFGASNDLQIYHNGSASVIKDAGTGNFYISGDNDVFISKADLSEVKAKFTSDGAVELNYDNVKKFETTSTGVDVTGQMLADTIRANTTGSASSPSIQIENDTGFFDSGAGHIGVATNGVETAEFEDNGRIMVRAEGSANLRVDLRQGSAKFWTNLEQYSSNSTRDSYNKTSFTDNGTGDFTVTINNDMNNRNYSYTACGQRGNNAIEDYSIMAYQNSYNNAHNTGSLRMVTMFASSASHSDMECNAVQICGDLA